ncbi:MAG: hypothetical protein ABL890_04570 [Candidatus Peribacteraceae bacterium]
MQHERRPILLGFISTLALSLVLTWHQQNVEFLLYVFVLVFLAFMVFGIDRHAHFSKGLLWCLVLWGLVHMLGGLVMISDSLPAQTEGGRRILYTLWLIPDVLKYDQAVHAYGYAICMWLSYQWFKSRYHTSGPTLGVLVLCGLASMGLGSVNEIIEFFAQRFIEDTNVGGYENTAWDLIFNLIGVVIAGSLIRYGHPAKEKMLGLRLF